MTTTDSLTMNDRARGEHDEASLSPVRIRVARGQALARAVMRIPPGALLFFPAFWVWPNLNFQPSAVSNRITDYAWAVIVVVTALVGLAVVVSGLRWLLLCVWPSTLAVVADGTGLRFRMGPFGVRRFDWKRLQARYRFEISVDDEDIAWAEVIDPEEEMTTRLPMLRHPEADEGIDVLLMRFAAVSEAALAQKLRPFLMRVREERDSDTPAQA